jgi:hypothetical protein
MMLTDQLDFNNPDHVTILCKDDQQLTIHIRDGNSSVRLIYQLQQEDNTSQPLHKYMTSDASIKAGVWPRDAFLQTPHPPLQPSEPDSDGSSEPERPLRGM